MKVTEAEDSNYPEIQKKKKKERKKNDVRSLRRCYFIANDGYEQSMEEKLKGAAKLSLFVCVDYVWEEKSMHESKAKEKERGK